MARRADNKTILRVFAIKGYVLVYNGTAFKSLDANKTSKILGFFNKDHMAYEMQRIN